MNSKIKTPMIELATREPSPKRCSDAGSSKANPKNQSGDWFWCDHGNFLWTPARVISRDQENVIVESKEDGKLCFSQKDFANFGKCESSTIVFFGKLIHLKNATFENLADMSEFNDAAILYQMRKRFFANSVYVFN
ncbi:hypothetical protein MHBO_001006 [Bonamia ostreae]|uniref:Uncharacterized protein n=1 Tax=Bonamia ostreae TaxID=126728 RepID=A0ABV2AHJ9_9EUKA